VINTYGYVETQVKFPSEIPQGIELSENIGDDQVAKKT